MWRIRPLFLASFLLAWPACAAEAAGDCPALAACASDAGPYDSWRQTSQGWQRCEDFLAPPIEYRRPALHPAVVGTLEILLSMTAMLALGGRPRAKVIDVRRASEAGRSPSNPP